MATIETVLFDLDGTLVYTAPDMGNALNTTLIESGRAAMPLEAIRPHVSKGGSALINLGFAITTEHDQHELFRQRFLHHYSEKLAEASALFEGMGELLNNIESRQLRWGIITNKPGWLTDPLLQKMGLHERSGCVVSGDTVAYAKPHPLPLLHACDLMGASPQNCIYIGDHERDIIAGKAANMKTLAALWGYIPDDEDPNTWGADGQLTQPNEILNWIS